MIHTCREYTTNKSKGCGQIRQIQLTLSLVPIMNWARTHLNQFCKSQRSPFKSFWNRLKEHPTLTTISSIQRLVIIPSIQKFSKIYNRCLGRKDRSKPRVKRNFEALCLLALELNTSELCKTVTKRCQMDSNSVWYNRIRKTICKIINMVKWLKTTLMEW